MVLKGRNNLGQLSIRLPSFLHCAVTLHNVASKSTVDCKLQTLESMVGAIFKAN